MTKPTKPKPDPKPSSKRKATKPERFTVEKVAEALRLTGAIRSAAAEKLRCAPTTITNYIERYPELLDVIAETQNATKDLAESKLLLAIDAGDLRAVTYYLDRQAKDRGYTTRTELTGAGGGPIVTGPDLSAYTDEELAQIRSIHEAAAARAGA